MSILTPFQRISRFALLAVALFTGATAHAQFGEAAGIAEAMQPDYFRRDIVLFQQGLNLDDTQRTIVDALYGDYEQAFEDGLARMRQRIEDMRDQLQSQDVDRVLRIVFKPIEDWSVEKRGLGNQFLENVKIVLTPEQQDGWDKFERFIFREKQLPRGRMSGESLNLFNLVRDMKLTEPQMQQVQPTLDEYDVALDAALRRRLDLLTTNQSDMLRSFAEQNASASLAILQRQIDTAVAVRNVNDEYIEKLAMVMPEGRQAEFRQNALERAYPRIYRATPVQNIFKAAQALEGLDPSLVASIVSLESIFLGELHAINAELAIATKQWEPTEQRLRAEAFAQRMAGQQPEQIEDATRALFLRRDELSRGFVRQLKDLMTIEQFGQVPGGLRWADLPPEPKAVDPAMPVVEPNSINNKGVAPNTRKAGGKQNPDKPAHTEGGEPE